MEQNNTHHLSNAQIERLALLAEECGELVQAIGKVLRHGYLSTGYSNREDLEREMGDVIAAMSMLYKTNDVDMDRVERRIKEKMVTVKTYLHYQGL